jgi:hypothetical protein
MEIPEGRLAEIFDRLHKAEQEISNCYNELRYLGVVRIKEAPPKEGTDGRQAGEDSKPHD